MDYCPSLSCFQFLPCSEHSEKKVAAELAPATHSATATAPATQPATEAVTEGGPSLEELAACLKDENEPVAKRYQTVYLIRNFGGERAVKALAPALSSRSVLLSHEVAYMMGQMQHPSALPYLKETLANSKLDPITRHEAAEAMAALSMDEAEPTLREYLNDPCVEVRDTCQIAVDRIAWRRAHPDLSATEKTASIFHSVDPAPGHAPDIKDKKPKELGDLLCDPSRSLFDRYTAMFALRNQRTEAAVLQLCRGFGDKSAVFRHEVAYVLGQVQHPVSIPALQERLTDLKEHAMVRHEAAEALGSINESDELLESFQKDSDSVVAESCDVALSIAEYWEDFEKQATTEA